MTINKIETHFYRGEYSKVLDLTIDNLAFDHFQDLDVLKITIAALSFVGRMEEALVLYKQNIAKCSVDQLVGIRFFIAIGLIRLSEYQQAKSLMIQNVQSKRQHKLVYESQFYVFQGLSFFHYFRGKYRCALKSAEKAFECANSCRFQYGKVLSSDILGHTLIALGEISRGQKLLDRASKFAKKMGSGGVVRAIQVSQFIYKMKFGSLNHINSQFKNELPKLPQDNYSQSQLLIGLAGYWYLNGNLEQMESALNKASVIAYSERNRRHQIRINIKYAQMYFSRGEMPKALSYILNSKELLHKDIDNHIELELLDLELKVLAGLELKTQQRALRPRYDQLRALTQDYLTRNIYNRSQGKAQQVSWHNPEDVIGEILNQMTIAVENDVVQKVIDHQLFNLLKKPFQVLAQETVVVFNIRGNSLTLFHKGNVNHIENGGSQIVKAFLKQLGTGAKSKQQLIEKVWGYSYDPIRHDQLLYVTVSKIRKLLGDEVGRLLLSTLDGYEFLSQLRVEQYTPVRKKSTNIQSNSQDKQFHKIKDHGGFNETLNHRQLKLLLMISRYEDIDVQSYKRLFKISQVTASRDLSDLVERGFLLKIGRARATKYISSIKHEAV